MGENLPLRWFNFHGKLICLLKNNQDFINFFMSYKNYTFSLSCSIVNIFCQVLLAEKSLVIIPLIIAMKNISNLNAQYSQFLILKRINCLLVETIKLKLYAMKNLRLILRNYQNQVAKSHIVLIQNKYYFCFSRLFLFFTSW